MAKKDASAGKKGKGGLVGLILVTLLALGFGAGFGFFLDGQMKGTAGDKAPAKVEEPPEKVGAKATLGPGAKLVTMAPIVANLAEPKDAWIRIEASIVTEGLDGGGDVLAAQLAEDFVAYLRTATLVQFQGPSGFQSLREDFKDRATIRDREHIKDVVIHGVIIE